MLEQHLENKEKEMKLKVPFTTNKFQDGEYIATEIKELKLDPDKFTPSVIMKAESRILAEGGMYPIGHIQESRQFLLIIAASMLSMKYSDLEEKLSGEDFLLLTDEVKDFFGGSGLQRLIQKISEESQQA